MYCQYLAAPEKFPKPWVQITADDEGVTSIYFVEQKSYPEQKIRILSCVLNN